MAPRYRSLRIKEDISAVAALIGLNDYYCGNISLGQYRSACQLLLNLNLGNLVICCCTPHYYVWNSGSIGIGSFFLVKIWKCGLEYICIDLKRWVPMLMIYSIYNKLHLEKMTKKYNFFSISVSQRNAVKPWVFIKVYQKYMLYSP